MEPTPVALRQMGKSGSDICARRAVMTLNRNAANLEEEVLDRLLRMERPSGNSSRVFIDDIGYWKVDASYQRRYLSAEGQRPYAAPLGAVRAQLQMGRLTT